MGQAWSEEYPVVRVRGSRAEEIPDRSRGGLTYAATCFGGARRAVVLVRVGFGLRGGGAGGLGDAGNEALDQLDRAFHGAAGVGAGVLEGGKGDHEGKDAPSWIAGSDGDGGSGDVVDILSVHILYFVSGFFALSLKSAATRGGQWEESSEGTTCSGPPTKPRSEGQR